MDLLRIAVEEHPWENCLWLGMGGKEGNYNLKTPPNFFKVGSVIFDENPFTYAKMY